MFGVSPAGQFPAGLGAIVPGASIAAGKSGSAWISSLTGDYSVDPVTGRLRQMPSVRQRVLLAVASTRGGSDALPEFGIAQPATIGPNFEQEQTQSIKDSLRQLILVEKLIRVDSVEFDYPRPGRVDTAISYTDLSTNEPDRVEI